MKEFLTCRDTDGHPVQVRRGRFLGVEFVGGPVFWGWGWECLSQADRATGAYPTVSRMVWFRAGPFEFNFERMQ